MFVICTNLSDSITGVFGGSTVVDVILGVGGTDSCRFGD